MSSLALHRESGKLEEAVEDTPITITAWAFVQRIVEGTVVARSGRRYNRAFLCLYFMLRSKP